jgi:hypothetical protein
MISESKFNASFPSIKYKLKEHLITIMGKNYVEKLEKKISNQMQPMLEDINKYTAQKTLQVVQQRADGIIESPFLEYILFVQYLSNPAREFYDGYRDSFRTKGHKKSQGIDLVLKIPKSWKSLEGERPHIVQKWVSQDGHGLEVIYLSITDIGGPTPSNDEVQEFATSKEIAIFIPSKAINAKSGIFSLEMRKGFWLEFGLISERINIEIYSHLIVYQLFFREKIIRLTCQVSNFVDDFSENRIKTYSKFKKFIPLFQQVLNSIVLLQAY